MSSTSVFDILGPIMIGPSSSHTAGACRLGGMARQMLQNEPKQATIYLHDSFQKTRFGHGTELAILGGVLGLEPENHDLKNAKKLADHRNLSFTFQALELPGEHPNSCQVNLKDKDGHSISITGSSIGGGRIIISKVDDFQVNLSGQFHALITKHTDRPGIVYRVTKAISSKDINIAYMQVSRTRKGKLASLIVETDQAIPTDIKEQLREDPDIEQIRVIMPIQ